ncbi:unnamed protein product, partial [Rotaria socialis]
HTLAKEQIKRLAKFGGAHHEDVVKWLSDVEEVFTRAQLQPPNKLLAVQSYLIDSAEKWFRYNKSIILDWSTFKIAIVKAYQPSLHETLLRLEQRLQLCDESVMDYYHDKIHLCLQADSNMSSSMIIHYLTKGLKQSLIAHVVRRHPATPPEFLAVAQDEEKIQFTLNGLSSASPNKPDPYPNEDFQMDHQVNAVTRPVNDNNRSFNWQHRQPLPQPLMNVPTTPFSSSSRRSYSQRRPVASTARQCYTCYVRYPDGNTSTKKKKPSPSSSSSSIHVPVNHVPTTILVDTGAAISLIHEQALSNMQHKPITPCSLKEVHTANSGFISLLGIVNLTVQINHLVTHVDAYVVRDLICPMILGRDWIQQNYADINFCTHRLYLYHGLVSTPLLPSPRHEPVLMSLSHSIIIPPFHQKFIYGSVPIKSLDDALFTPNIALQHARLVLLPHSLLHIRDNRGVVSIINNTRHSKLIPRNTPL